MPASRFVAVQDDVGDVNGVAPMHDTAEEGTQALPVHCWRFQLENEQPELLQAWDESDDQETSTVVRGDTVPMED